MTSTTEARTPPDMQYPKWVSQDGTVYREVVWEEDDGRRYKTGVQEKIAREIERRTIVVIRERFNMREVSVGPRAAFSKRSVNEVLDGEQWDTARPLDDGLTPAQEDDPA